MKRLLSCFILTAVFLAGCRHTEPSNGEKPVATTPSGTVATPVPNAIALYLDDMTLEQKIGQLFIVEAEQLVSQRGAVTAVTEELKENLAHYPVGGVVFFKENVQTPDQLLALIKDLQAASEIPMFISTDEEGGKVTRLASNEAFNLPKYQSAAAVGSSGNPADALEMGQTIGGYLKTYGLNLDFAPVADVNTNPNNPVIGTRAFSSNPVIAGQMADAFASGLRNNQVIATYKHFPGHGDTAEDSHLGIAVNHKTKQQLQSCEWIPFQNAGETDMVMVGHIALPQVTGDMIPATMSKMIVTDILKKELMFPGIVITDALNMGAITQTYSPKEAAVNALQAGCDVLLMPENLTEAYEGVLAAVQDGTLTEEWLDETVYRILKFKQENGILKI